MKWNIQDLVRLCCCSFDFSCLMIQNNNIVCNTLLELVSALESKYRTTMTATSKRTLPPIYTSVYESDTTIMNEGVGHDIYLTDA